MIKISSLCIERCFLELRLRRILTTPLPKLSKGGQCIVGELNEEMITKSGAKIQVNSGDINISQSIKANENTTKILEALKR